VLAVSITIGTPLSAWISRHTSMPSLPGSITSSKTRSGEESRKAAKARSHRSQKTASKRSERRTMPIISASAVSSSTTTTRPFICSSCHDSGETGRKRLVLKENGFMTEGDSSQEWAAPTEQVPAENPQGSYGNQWGQPSSWEQANYATPYPGYAGT